MDKRLGKAEMRDKFTRDDVVYLSLSLGLRLSGKDGTRKDFRDHLENEKKRRAEARPFMCVSKIKLKN